MQGFADRWTSSGTSLFHISIPTWQANGFALLSGLNSSPWMVDECVMTIMSPHPFLLDVWFEGEEPKSLGLWEKG